MLCQFQIKTGKAVPWFPAKPAKDHVHQFKSIGILRQSKAYWMQSRNAKMRGQGSIMSVDLKISNSQMTNDEEKG